MTFTSVAQLVVIFWEAWVQIPSEPEFFLFFLLFFLFLLKLQLTCKDHVFFNFTLAAPNFFFFFTNTQRKEENLCFDNILFVNDWSVINKISPVSPNHVFSKWKGRGGNVYFEQSLYEKKSELIIFFLIIAYVKGKAP